MKQLTKEEKDFCNLYIYGDAIYAYQPARCYMTALAGIYGDAMHEINGIEEVQFNVKAKKLLKQNHIREHINAMINDEDNDMRTRVVREMLINRYQAIMAEAATHCYEDEDGNKVVPPSLRGVAVQAGKALTEILPVKESTKDDGVGQATITFTVVAPENNKKDE